MGKHIISALVVILSTCIALGFFNLVLVFAGTKLANLAMVGAIVCLPTVIILLDNIANRLIK